MKRSALREWEFAVFDHLDALGGLVESASWKQVSVPHDWAILEPPCPENPAGASGGFYRGGVGLYRRSLKLEPNLQYYLLFEGIYMNSSIYLDRKRIGGRTNGYLPLLIPLDRPDDSRGEQELLVLADNRFQPSDRWYTGCGLYRNCTLFSAEGWHLIPETLEALCISADEQTGLLHLRAEARGPSVSEEPLHAVFELIDPRGNLARRETVLFGGKDADRRLETTLEVDRPYLWSAEHPFLYTLRLRLEQNGVLLDEQESEVGIRSFETGPNGRFTCNGETVFLKGVCLHHDLGALGAAYYPSAMERRLRHLKAIGVNAIRFGHSPMPRHFLAAADRMGFFLIAEAFDKWALPWETEGLREKWDSFGGSLEPFEDRWEKDLQDFIRTFRRHPSIVVWSLGNEVTEQIRDPLRAVEIFRDLKECCTKYDPTRPVTAALYPQRRDDGSPSDLVEWMDVVSYNYQSQYLEEDRARYPGKLFLNSEVNPYVEGNKDRSNVHYKHFDAGDNGFFAARRSGAGHFIWAGFDYLGESRGWPWRGWEHCLFDTAGFKRPFTWYIQALYANEPFVKVCLLDVKAGERLEAADHWQIHWQLPKILEAAVFEKGRYRFLIFSNCPEIDLNFGRGGERILMPESCCWQSQDLAEIPSELITVNGLQDGEAVCQDVFSFARHEDLSFECRASTDRAPAHPDELIFVEMRIVDARGCPVERATEVNVACSGSVELVALDNGDLSDPTPFSQATRMMPTGRALAILRVGQEGRGGALTINADGYKVRRLDFSAD